MVKAAKPTPTRGAATTGAAARAGGEFFGRPTGPNHRRYEALRGYLFEGLSYRAAAARSGYSIATLRSLVRDFRAGKTGFFLNPRPGPTRAPAKNAARDKIIELRRTGLSAAQISQALAGTATPLNRTGVAQVLAAAGLGRLPARPPGSTGPPFRDHPARAGLIDFDQLPARSSSKAAGLLLTLPDLVALDLPALVTAAGYPGTSAIGAVNYLLSLLALKLTGTRRVSHVDDLAADPGAALFAGLTALPKTTALTTYSHRLEHTRQSRLLTALGKAMIAANLITDTGGDLDLDFHAIMHWGEDVALEKHYVPSRSQRTRSVLSFFAQDGASQTLVYANADLSKATQSNEVLVFADHWKTLTGAYPHRLVMDQKVTTQNVLDANCTTAVSPSSPCGCDHRPDPTHRRPARHRVAHRAPGPRRPVQDPQGRRRDHHPVRLPLPGPATDHHRPRPGHPDRDHHQRHHMPPPNRSSSGTRNE